MRRKPQPQRSIMRLPWKGYRWSSMNQPRIAMLSLWRDDADKNLYGRVDHLLNKQAVARWVWVVGDCHDNTEQQLRAQVEYHAGLDIELVVCNTGIEGEDGKTRVRRLSVTASAGLDRVRPGDDYWVIHESDLRSPRDVVKRFLESGKDVIAGWPTLDTGGAVMFYDSWAYRKDGQHFTNTPPFHACYHPRELFEVDSVGSCWMLPAAELRAGVRCQEWACVELCQKMKARGRSIWVDPLIEIQQPRELWVSRAHA
jgi:hypothetical protein